MEFVKKLEETFNSGDPVAREWFLVRNNYLPFILCFGFVVMSLVGPTLMRKREPFELRTTMIVFNFSIVLSYAIGLSVAIYYFPMISWEQYCGEKILIEGQPTYILFSTAWIAYILKYIEFCDTAFFILRKKEHLVSFLHVVHHTTAPLVGWTMFRTQQNALQAIPVMLNGFVHVVMYTYYGLAAMGPKVRKYLWWKKYLTQLQIVQFIFIILYAAVVVPFIGCKMVVVSYLMDIILAPFFLYLFYMFYKVAFKPATKKID